MIFLIEDVYKRGISFKKEEKLIIIRKFKNNPLL
jgi:hypothetical protein